MKMNLDNKLYNDYLKGNTEAFEVLYLKYKNKITYFIFNIIKDYEKAQDIAQDVFVYILKNKVREEGDFKYYVYLVAKSKAINYINKEKRRNDINERYLKKEDIENESDILELITKEEEKNMLLESISLLEEKYRNTMYLVNIEEFSYQETADILDISVQDVKNYIHRGKKQLKKILIKNGFDNMNKATKVLIIICICIMISGIAYAITRLYNIYNTNHNITITPSYTNLLDENTSNNVWIGTLDLAWKELTKKIKGKIELEEDVNIANELNESKFSKEMLSNDNYKISVTTNGTGGYDIVALLSKKLKFLYGFDNFSFDLNWTFGKDNDEYIKYFGINNASAEEMNENVKILFFNEETIYNNSKDCAVELKTQEGDEIILYRTDDNKSFDEYYKDIQVKTEQYTGEHTFQKADQLYIPYVRVNGLINYNELKNKKILNAKNKEGQDLYINEVVQEVNFYLNEKGCNMNSKATMVTTYASEGERYIKFDDTFILFMKEKNADMPYFALKVDSIDILEKKDENIEAKIVDYVYLTGKYDEIETGEYKFYEDDDYEYYYPDKRTNKVKVFYKNGDIEIVEEALKKGKITIGLLDEYEIRYIKKQK